MTALLWNSISIVASPRLPSSNDGLYLLDRTSLIDTKWTVSNSDRVRWTSVVPVWTKIASFTQSSWTIRQMRWMRCVSERPYPTRVLLTFTTKACQLEFTRCRCFANPLRWLVQFINTQGDQREREGDDLQGWCLLPCSSFLLCHFHVDK